MMKAKSIAFLTIILLAIALGACASEPNQPDPPFPTFVYDSALSLRAYRLATRNPEMLTKLPCYCDCGRASGHTSLNSCFFRTDGSYNDHASGCEVCGLETVDAAQWAKEGKSLKQIRTMIDTKYSPYGTPTNTAPVD